MIRHRLISFISYTAGATRRGAREGGGGFLPGKEGGSAHSQVEQGEAGED